MVAITSQKSGIEAFLENDFNRAITGLAIAILGMWSFAEIFRAWAYADHWAEPLVIGFCFFVLGWTPFIGFGLIFAYEKDPDPNSAEMAERIALALEDSGWTHETQGNKMTMTAPDGKTAVVEIAAGKEKAHG